MDSVKDEARQLVESLSDDCTWDDVYRVVGMMAGKTPPVVRELQRHFYRPEVIAPPSMEDDAVSTFFDVVVERDADGYYVGSVPALAGCHTQASSLDQLLERLEEAASLCMEVSGGERTGMEVVGIRRIAVRA